MTIPPLPLTPVSPVETASVSGLSGPSLDSALQDFEGVFVSLLLKEMRKSVGTGFFGNDSADAIGGLFDMTLGEELGRQGGLGIATALARYREVAETNGAATPSGEVT